VLSCHLSLQTDERQAQGRLLLERLAALDTRHSVAAGDFNERPGGRTFRRLAAELQDCWAVKPWGSEYTSTPQDPHQRIDAVLASESIEVLGCGVPAELEGVSAADLRVATDHLPVLAALRVPPEQAPESST
jgi:endonuclease/exonuclease/phosphatase family metal-dependent hydrolase